MEIVGTILVIFLIICFVTMLAFDPLEKYDKTLDDPDHKVGGFWEDYIYGRVPPRKRPIKKSEEIEFSPKDEKLLFALQKFVKGAELYEKGTLDGNSAEANQGHDELAEAYKIIKNLDSSLSEFKTLLHHHKVGVRLEVAVRLLSSDEESALETLQDIDKRKGSMGFTAHMVIEDWKNGELHF